jgi:hypothetical protein
MRSINAGVAVAILLIFPASVKAATPSDAATTPPEAGFVSSTIWAVPAADSSALTSSASGASSTVLIPPPDALTLTLDSGFVGRPVSLGLFSDTFTIAWDVQTLLKPTTLTVWQTNLATSTGQTVAAKGVSVAFGPPDVLAAKGKYTVKMKASRLPVSPEHLSVNVTLPNATSSIPTIPYRNGSMTFTQPARPLAAFMPVFDKTVMQQGTASWYKYKGCLCAASPDVPKGTRMVVTRLDNPKKFVVVKINDWGPERDQFPNRVIDLDKVAFRKIANLRGGVIEVRVEVITKADPRWKQAGK